MEKHSAKYQGSAIVQRYHQGLPVNTKIISKARSSAEVIKIDKKSSEPRNEQIRRQVIQFTNNQNARFKEFISTDQFTELIELEKEFGAVEIGHANENSPQKNLLWKKIVDLLFGTDEEMSEFNKFVNKAKIELNNDADYTWKRFQKKQLDCLNNDFYEMLQPKSDPLEKVRLKKKKTKKILSQRERLDEAKQLIIKLSKMSNKETNELRNIRALLGLKLFEAYPNSKSQINSQWTNFEWASLLTQMYHEKSTRHKMRNIESDYKNIEPKVDCKWLPEQQNNFASFSKQDPGNSIETQNLFQKSPRANTAVRRIDLFDSAKNQLQGTSNQDTRPLTPSGITTLTPRQIQSLKSEVQSELEENLVPERTMLEPRKVQSAVRRNHFEIKNQRFANLAVNQRLFSAQQINNPEELSNAEKVSSNQLRSLVNLIRSNIPTDINNNGIQSQSGLTGVTTKQSKKSTIMILKDFCQAQLILAGDEVELQIKVLQDQKAIKDGIKTYYQSNNGTTVPRREINMRLLGLKRWKSLIESVQCSLKIEQITLEQLLQLKNCEIFNSQALRAMVLMYRYWEISDQFGFNAKEDRQEILKNLELIKRQLQSGDQTFAKTTVTEDELQSAIKTEGKSHRLKSGQIRLKISKFKNSRDTSPNDILLFKLSPRASAKRNLLNLALPVSQRSARFFKTFNEGTTENEQCNGPQTQRLQHERTYSSPNSEKCQLPNSVRVIVDQTKKFELSKKLKLNLGKQQANLAQSKTKFVGKNDFQAIRILKYSALNKGKWIDKLKIKNLDLEEMQTGTIETERANVEIRLSKDLEQ